MVDFNMFNYLKIKGFSNNQLAANFQEIEKANQNINEILENNPDAVLKKIEYKYLDKEKKQLQFEIKIEVVVSCSSVGKRTVPDSAVVSRDVVVNNSIAEIKKKFSEDIKSENVGLYKKGFRNWKVILYGKQAYYQVFVTEDGKIVSSERFEYK